MSAPYADPAHSASGLHIQQGAQAPTTPGSSSSRDRSKQKTELSQEIIARLQLLPDPTPDEPPTMQYSNCWIAYRTAFVNVVKAKLPEAQKAQMQCTSEAARRYKELTVAQKKAWTDYAVRSKQLHQANPNSRGAKRRRTVEMAEAIAAGGLLDSPFTSAPVPLPADADAQAAERVASSGKTPRARSSKGSRASPLADSRPTSAHGDAPGLGRIPPPPLYIPPASIHAPSPVSAGSQPGWEARIDPALSMLSGSENESMASQCGSSRHSPATPATFSAHLLAASSVPQHQHAMNWGHSLPPPLAIPHSASPVPMQESQNYMYPAAGAAAWPIPPFAGHMAEPQFASALPSDLRYAQLAPLSDRTTGEGYGTQQQQQQQQQQQPAAAHNDHNTFAPPPSGSGHDFTGYEYAYAQFTNIQQDTSMSLGLTLELSNAGSGTPSPEHGTLPEMQAEVTQSAPQIDFAYADNVDPMFAYVYGAVVPPEFLYAFDDGVFQ